MADEEKKPPEQIPWALRTKVRYQSDLSIALENDPMKVFTADIWHGNFEWSVVLNSKIMIDTHMTQDERLTKDIQEFWEAEENKYLPGGTFREKILRWLKGDSTFGKMLPKRGPKEWRPRGVLPKKKANLKKDEGYGYANTYNEDNAYYWGDVFEFAHFETEDGDEGAVILWQGGGDPRGNYHLPMVYMGDFQEFMDSQYEHDPWNADTFLTWNAQFENGFMWAWEKMGVFDDPGEQIEDYKDKHVQQVLKAIQQDPSILLPESVQKIVDRFDEFPDQIQKAVTWLMANQRQEIEKALGQKLIWEDLYRG